MFRTMPNDDYILLQIKDKNLVEKLKPILTHTKKHNKHKETVRCAHTHTHTTTHTHTHTHTHTGSIFFS